MTVDLETSLKLNPDFEKGDGLVTAIAQDVMTKDVLMCAFMNREALEADP